jgi:sulfatase maturation enzyme AslB (radical SAM superfamily)
MKINQRLFDHYGIDTTKDLGISTICPRPFDTVLIDKRGSCYACECQSWLPQSIGNLQVKSLQQIIESSMRDQLQASIQDKSYRYCNNKQCSWIMSGNTGQWSRVRPDGLIRHLRLAIDDSCNLRCPSCRDRLIFHKEGASFRLGTKLSDRINQWLTDQQQTIQVHVGSDGDPFASHVYRHFMEQTPKRDNIKYSILTNGLMFPEVHTRVPHVIDNLQELGVSIDGATKETYEKLRLGGKWDKLLEGLESMAEQKQKHGFRFTLHFVVQKDNYHEMEKIVSLGEYYGVDRVYLNRIQDWGSMHNFAEQDIFQSPDYLKCLEGVVALIKQRGDEYIQCPTLIAT